MAIYLLSKRDEFGYPIGYRSASAAGCALSLIPSEGLIFYAPLAQAESFAATGQQLDVSGSITYREVNGVPCALFNSSRIDTHNNIGISGNASVTLSAWLKTDSGHTTTSAVNIGSNNSFSMFAIGEDQGKAFVTGYAADYTSNISITDRLHHVAATYDKSSITLYVDGVLIHSYSANLNISQSTLCIGSSHGSFKYNGYISSVRVYNRALTAKEIHGLSKEFDI